MYKLWLEFEEQTTPEAKFAKALDSMEANYQSILYESIEYWDDIYYDLALTKSDPHCQHDQFLEVLNSEIKKRIIPEMEKIGLDTKEKHKTIGFLV